MQIRRDDPGVFPKMYDDDKYLDLVQPHVQRLFLYMLSKRKDVRSDRRQKKKSMQKENSRFADSILMLTAEKASFGGC